MEKWMFLVPAAAVIALLFAVYLANKVSRQSVGTDRMKEISGAIAEGARAFLTAEYKILVIFVAVLFVLIGVGIGSWVTAVCFVVGIVFNDRGILWYDSGNKGECQNSECGKRERNE